MHKIYKNSVIYFQKQDINLESWKKYTYINCSCWRRIELSIQRCLSPSILWRTKSFLWTGGDLGRGRWSGRAVLLLEEFASNWDWKLIFGGLASETAGETHSMLCSREGKCRDLGKYWICMCGSAWGELRRIYVPQMSVWPYPKLLRTPLSQIFLCKVRFLSTVVLLSGNGDWQEADPWLKGSLQPKHKWIKAGNLSCKRGSAWIVGCFKPISHYQHLLLK